MPLNISKRSPLLMMALLCVFMLSGCFTVRYTNGAPAAGTPTTTRSHHLVAGLVTVRDPVNLKTVCPSGVSEIQHNHTFVDGLIGALTSNLYKPTTFTITCADGSAHEMSAEEIKQAHLDSKEVAQ